MASLKLRMSKVPISSAVLRLVRGDSRTQDIEMYVDRYAGGVDLIDLVWAVNYVNADGASDTSYLGSGDLVDGDIVLTWTVPALATAAVGKTVFELEGIAGDEAVWQSGSRAIKVSDDVDSNPVYDAESLSEVQKLINTVGTTVAGLTAQVEEAVESANQAVESVRETVEHVGNLEYEASEAEVVRELAESERASAENAREDAEAARKVAETERVEAENMRVQADEERRATDGIWEIAEQARVAAEIGRVSAEEDRVSNEENRVSAELDRASAENHRVTAEETREYNERQRVLSEQSRSTAETLRASAEKSRKTAESDRVTAETARATAESVRASAERVRVSAETNRVNAESQRANAESKRATDTANAISNANAAAGRVDTAIANANSAAQEARENIADVAEVKKSNAELKEDLSALEQTVDGKQDALVSGENIKTVNGQSLLGGGSITIQGGGGSYDDSEIRTELEEHDERITALEKVWDVYADNADGNKTVPTGSVQASVQMIGGKSEVIGNEIVSADVESVTCDDVVRVIPSAVRALDGYGWSAGSVYNSIEQDGDGRWWYHKRVGAVDLGEYAKVSKVTTSQGAMYRYVIDGIVSTNNRLNMLCANYITTTQGKRGELTVSGASINADFIDSRYDSVDAFKIANYGVMLYYELAEPIVTDITDLIGDTLNWLAVDDGDTIIFDNAAGLAVPNEVQYRVKPSQTDVQINGTSIVENGVANIPYATNSTYGITKPFGNGNYGVGADANGGGLYVFKASDSHISTRSHQYAPIVPTNLNFAVKAALTDSNHVELTDDEKATAREVLGVSGEKPWELKATITTASNTSLTSVDFSGCTEFMIFGKYTGAGSASVFRAGLNGETTPTNTLGMLVFPSATTAQYVTVYAHFKDTCNGIECVAYGNYKNNVNVLSNSVSIFSGSTVYHNFDCSVSEITGLLFPNASSPSIKIYAR